jgi:nucleoside-triphosphatase THEP1
MAIYHSHAGFVSRSSGRSAVAASSYISGSKLVDERQGIIHDYCKKQNVVFSGILVPDNAPSWARSAENLWNRAEVFEDEIAENRFRGDSGNPEKDAKSLAAKIAYITSAQTAQTLECALPIELDKEICNRLVQEFLSDRFVSRGLGVEYAIHWDEGNPHFHAMITRRSFDSETGDFSFRKDRQIVEKSEIKETRRIYADKVNHYLELGGYESRVDHRSFAEMGLDIEPTKHRGWKASKLVEQGLYSRIESENQQIRERNIEAIFENPEEIIMEVAQKRSVFTADDIAANISKRVDGDEILFGMLYERVKGIEVPYAGSEIAANDNRRLYQGIDKSSVDGKREQQEYQRVLKENTKIYAEELLMESQESVYLGSDVRDRDVYSLREEIQREKELFARIEVIKGDKDSAVGKGLPEEVVKYHSLKKEQSMGRFARLSEEQADAVEYLCGEGRIKNLIGRAGSGKTTLLKVVADSYKHQGYRVIGTSFQGKVVEIMAAEIGIESYTLEHLRRAWEEQERLQVQVGSGQLSSKALDLAQRRIRKLEEKRFTSKDVVIVDEANMVGMGLYESLFAEVERVGAKLILVQDPAQIKAHDGRDVCSAILERSDYYGLKGVIRQKELWQRQASQYLNEHEVIAGLRPYAEHGNIQWHENQDGCYEQIVRDYVTGYTRTIIDSEGSGEVRENKKHLFMTFINSKVSSINQRIHDSLKQGVYLTEHYMVGEKEFSVGERIVFTGRNENTGKIVVTEENPDNSRTRGVRNGSFATIIAIEKNEFKVRLEDNRLVSFNPHEYGYFTYGYGITINKAEGYTCDRSYVLFDKAMNANLTLIAMTRHREDVQGYVIEEDFADFKSLTDKLAYSQRRDLAVDYTIDERRKAYFDNVREYKRAASVVQQIASDMLDFSSKQERFTALTTALSRRKDIANIICADYASHGQFLNHGNVRKHVIEYHAGLRERELSGIELKHNLRLERFETLLGEKEKFTREEMRVKVYPPDRECPKQKQLDLMHNNICKAAYDICGSSIYHKMVRGSEQKEKLERYAKGYEAILFKDPYKYIESVRNELLKQEHKLKATGTDRHYLQNSIRESYRAEEYLYREKENERLYYKYKLEDYSGTDRDLESYKLYAANNNELVRLASHIQNNKVGYRRFLLGDSLWERIEGRAVGYEQINSTKAHKIDKAEKELKEDIAKENLVRENFANSPQNRFANDNTDLAKGQEIAGIETQEIDAKEFEHNLKQVFTSYYKKLEVHERSLYRNQGREEFVEGCTNRYKELYVNLAEIRGGVLSAEEAEKLEVRALVEHHYYNKSYRAIRSEKIHSGEMLTTEVNLECRQYGKMIAYIAGRVAEEQQLTRDQINNYGDFAQLIKRIDEKTKDNIESYNFTGRGKEEVVSIIKSKGELRLEFELRYGGRFISKEREAFFEKLSHDTVGSGSLLYKDPNQAQEEERALHGPSEYVKALPIMHDKQEKEQNQQGLSELDLTNQRVSELSIKQTRPELHKEIEEMHKAKLDCLKEYVIDRHKRDDGTMTEGYEQVHQQVQVTREQNFAVLAKTLARMETRQMEHEFLKASVPACQEIIATITLADIQHYKESLTQSLESFNTTHHQTLQKELERER